MEFNCDNKAHFSGHETFVCKSLWLKKGYDFVKEHHSFNDDDAVVYLGVGKNMVASIRYWLLSFGLMNQDNKISPFADYIFSTETGCDPFVEDNQTLWLLHWSLVYTNYATIYRQLFCDFHRHMLSLYRIYLNRFYKVGSTFSWRILTYNVYFYK